MRKLLARYGEAVRAASRVMLTRSNVRDLTELLGFGLIVGAAFQVSTALGLLAGGIALVIAGNLA